jgi:hypothetical protein
MMDALFASYRDMKRDACRDGEVDRDVSMLLYLGEGPMDDVQTQVLCIVIPTGGREDMVQALAAAMARMFVPYWAAVLSDGYVMSADDAPDIVPAGGLGALFALGDKNVRECLTITGCDHTGDVYADSVTYWYDDDGDVWFRDDEESPVKGTSEGPMIDVLKDVTSLWGKTQAEIIAVILERTVDMN